MTRRFANIAHQSDKASPQSWLCSFLRAEKLTSQRARGTRVDYVYNRRNQLTRMLHTKAATVLLGLSYLLNPDGSRASIPANPNKGLQRCRPFVFGSVALGFIVPFGIANASAVLNRWFAREGIVGCAGGYGARPRITE